MVAPSPALFDAIVIGGGIAGLIVARDLGRSGLKVCLFEAAPRLGGRMRQVTIAGLPVELGAEAFATRTSAVAELLHELGLGDDIVAPERRPAWVLTPQTRYSLPESGALGIPAQPFAVWRTIGIRAAAAIACEPWRPRSKHPHDATLADVAHARIGARATAALIAPVTEGVYSASPGALRFDEQPELAAAYARTGSLVRAAREVRASRLAAGGAVAGIAGGLSRLIAALETELRQLGVTSHTSATVSHLARSGGADRPEAIHTAPRWQVTAGQRTVAAPIVVCAVPEATVRQLTAPVLPEPDIACESDAPATAVETVALVVDAPELDSHPCGTGALVRPGHPSISAKALTHFSAKWSWVRELAPDGRHVLRLSYGSRDKTPATATLSDEAAADLARRDAEQILGWPLAPRQVIGFARARWRVPPRAQDCSDSRGTARADHLTTGLFTTGEAYAGTGLASVVPHARATARDVFQISKIMPPLHSLH